MPKAPSGAAQQDVALRLRPRLRRAPEHRVDAGRQRHLLGDRPARLRHEARHVAAGDVARHRLAAAAAFVQDRVATARLAHVGELAERDARSRSRRRSAARRRRRARCRLAGSDTTTTSLTWLPRWICPTDAPW